MMQRQQKRQDQNGSCDSVKFEKEDCISRLPDEVLIQILSLLTVDEEQITSVLSPRWRYLWTHMTCLNFAYFSYNHLERSKYINWVNKVCSSMQSPRIVQFRMISDLDGKAKDNVNKWVQFAMAKGVKDLELVMSIYAHNSDGHIFGCPATVSSDIANKHLRSLTLSCINISGEALEHFLLHCQSLEQITIHQSYHLKTLKVGVGVGGPLLNLKSLKISSCFNLEDLKISAPKLSNFQFQGLLISLDVENYGDRLTWAFVALSSYLCQIDQTDLVLRLQNIHVDFQQSWKLTSLRELTVKFSGSDSESLLFTLSFLKATPFPEKLRLESELKNYQKLLEERTDAVCPHKHLKVLEIIGFNAHPSLVKFVKHLSVAAPKLEKIVIDPYSPWKSFGPKCSRKVFVKKFTELFEKLSKSVILRTDFVLEIMD